MDRQAGDSGRHFLVAPSPFGWQGQRPGGRIPTVCADTSANPRACCCAREPPTKPWF